MTAVAAVRLLETCLDRTIIKQVELASGIDEATMRRVADGATLQYFPSFPRPYFRIARERTWVVQGIVGDPLLRVTFSPLAPVGAESELLDRLVGDRAASRAESENVSWLP